MFRACRTQAATVTLMTIAALAALAPVVQGQPPKAEATKEQKDKPLSFWMERKLQLSKDLLAGLTEADFDKIAASAQAMRTLNKIEAFVRGRTPGYRTQLQIFDDALAEIEHQAQRDNVEGAALAYTQLTISCVNCHKQLRAGK